jgi:hypothetical protein
MQRILGILFCHNVGRHLREFLLMEEKGFHSLPKGDFHLNETPESAFERLAYEFFARHFGTADKRHIVGSFDYWVGNWRKEAVILIQEVPKSFSMPYGHGYVPSLWTSRPTSVRLDPFSQAVFEHESVLPYLPFASGFPARP